MKLGLMNDARNSLFKEIKSIKKLGFDFVDISLEYPKCHPSMLDPIKIKNFLKKKNLNAVGHTFWGLPFLSPYPRVREATLSELLLKLKFFSEINVKLMNVHLDEPFRWFKEKAFDWYYVLLRRLVTEGKKKNITIMLEHNSGEREHMNLYGKLMKKLPDLKIHFDVGHANLGNNAVKLTSRIFKKYNKRIAHIHVSDNDGRGDKHLPLRKGNINWRAIVKILKKYNYNKTITLEIFKGGTKGILQSKNYLEELWKS